MGITAPAPTRTIVRNQAAARVHSGVVSLAGVGFPVTFVWDLFPGVVDRNEIQGPTANNGNPVQARNTYMGLAVQPMIDVWLMPLGVFAIAPAVVVLFETANHWNGGAGPVAWNRCATLYTHAEQITQARVRVHGTRLRVTLGSGAAIDVQFAFTFRPES